MMAVHCTHGYLHGLDSGGMQGKRATLSSLEGSLGWNLCICMQGHWIISVTSETDVTSLHPETSATDHTVRGSCSQLKCCFTSSFENEGTLKVSTNLHVCANYFDLRRQFWIVEFQTVYQPQSVTEFYKCCFVICIKKLNYDYFKCFFPNWPHLWEKQLWN